MSQENKIDALFRDALGDKGMEYAPEHWEQMETLLPKQKKPATKRKLGLLALALLLLSSIAYFGLQTETETLGDSSPVPSEALTTPESVLKQNSLSSNISQPTEVPSSSENETPINAAQLNANPINEKQNKTVPKNDLAPSEKKELPDQGSIPPHSTKSKQTTGNETGSLLVSNNPSNPIKETSDLELDENLPGPTKLIVAYDVLKIAEIQNFPFRLNYDLNFTYVRRQRQISCGPRPGKTVTRRRRSMYNWSIMPYMNLGMVNHRQDATVSSWKKNTEASKNYMEYGANARFQKERFGIVFGLAMQNWTEKTNYTQEEHHYTFDYHYELIERNYEQRSDGSYAGLIQKVTDTTSHSVTNTVICQDCPVSFSYITVPIAFHYEMGNGKLTGYAQAGLNFSFLNKASGVYSVTSSVENGQTSLHFANADKAYFNPMVLRSNLTLGAKYRFHPLVSLNLQANYQRSMNSMMTRYRQESDFYGFGLGLEFLIH